MRDATHVQGSEKFAGQNEAVMPSLLAGDSTSSLPSDKFVCPLIRLLQVVRVSLRKSGESFGPTFSPADFGGANFPVPWTTRKAGFDADLNFFTASPQRGERVYGGNSRPHKDPLLLRNTIIGLKAGYIDDI